MEHVVFYPGAEGAPAFKRVGSLEDAVRLVEHLRNVEGVADVSVHSLTEVPMAFKAYYKVEVPVAAEPAVEAAEAPAAEAPVAEVPAQEVPTMEVPALEGAVDPTSAGPSDVPAEPAFAGAEPVAAQSNGHREVTGLGFFAS